MRRQTIFVSLLFMGFASSDLLQNPDFESPPANLTGNSTSSFVLLGPNNTIPGWTFEGTVQYVTVGQNISLPGDGHGIQLCQDGKINQTFVADGNISDYLLTFTLAVGGRNCSENADVVISAPDSSKVFSFKQNYSTEPWETFGHYLGSWGQGEPVNLVFQSQTTESNPNSTCWPVVDSILLKSVATVQSGTNENLLPNVEDSKSALNSRATLPREFYLKKVSAPLNLQYGHGLYPEPSNSKNPEQIGLSQGGTAVELVSGVSAGIRTVLALKEGWGYTLEFTLGNSNDSCVGDVIVGVETGRMMGNFSLASSFPARKVYSVFSGDPSETPISFFSYTTTRTRDGVFCGPVVADLVLRASTSNSTSHGIKLETPLKVLVSVYVLAAVLLNHSR